MAAVRLPFGPVKHTVGVDGRGALARSRVRIAVPHDYVFWGTSGVGSAVLALRPAHSPKACRASISVKKCCNRADLARRHVKNYSNEKDRTPHLDTTGAALAPLG
jgi:hypothetical protein